MKFNKKKLTEVASNIFQEFIFANGHFFISFFFSFLLKKDNIHLNGKKCHGNNNFWNRSCVFSLINLRLRKLIKSTLHSKNWKSFHLHLHNLILDRPHQRLERGTLSVIFQVHSYWLPTNKWSLPRNQYHETDARVLIYQIHFQQI